MPAAGQMYTRIAREVSPEWAQLSDSAACERLVAWLGDLCTRFEIPRLRDLGATASDVPELVSLTLEHFSASINPRPLRIEDAQAIYEAAL